MKFMILSSLGVLTTMFILFHEVHGIRHRIMISSVSVARQMVAFSDPPISTKGVKSGDPAIEEKMTVVPRRTRSTLSTEEPAGDKKPQQHQHHHHWMPSIHEDYFGPRHHKPTHH